MEQLSERIKGIRGMQNAFSRFIIGFIVVTALWQLI